MTQAVKLVKLSQASDVAKTISNKTAQLIIEHIGKKQKSTASELAKELKLPASTVHYNMKALVKGGIVDDSQFTYSEKGKTIIHYTLTNNIIIIIPESRDEFSLLNTIKALVPSIVGVGLLGLAYTVWGSRFSAPFEEVAIQESAANIASDEAVFFAAKAAPQPAAQTIIETTTSSTQEFVLGLAVATIVILLIFLIRSWYLKRKNHQ